MMVFVAEGNSWCSPLDTCSKLPVLIVIGTTKSIPLFEIQTLKNLSKCLFFFYWSSFFLSFKRKIPRFLHNCYFL